MRDFREIKVWEKAHRLTLSIYSVTRAFPKEELFGLVSQSRRAAASIAANIAEGCCRDTNADFARFLRMSIGSASELDYHLLLAKDLNFITPSDYEQLASVVSEVKRMLASFIRTLTADS
jgi:four helix bundle protein